MTTAVEPLTEDLADGFVPADGDGGGYDVAATLQALPGVFTSVSGSLSALAAWMPEAKLGGLAAELVAEMAGHAATAAEAAEEAYGQFRQAGEFWLTGRDGDAAVMRQLAEDAEIPLIPDGEDGPPAYQLADTLAALPWFFELLAEQLAALGDWMGEHKMAGEGDGVLAGVLHCAGILASAAENADAQFRAQNHFWLSDRRPRA